MMQVRAQLVIDTYLTSVRVEFSLSPVARSLAPIACIWFADRLETKKVTIPLIDLKTPI